MYAVPLSCGDTSTELINVSGNFLGVILIHSFPPFLVICNTPSSVAAHITPGS